MQAYLSGEITKNISSKGNQSLKAWSRKASEISCMRNKYTFSGQSAEHNSCTVIQLTSVYSIVILGRNKGAGCKVVTCAVLTAMRVLESRERMCGGT